MIVQLKMMFSPCQTFSLLVGALAALTLALTQWKTHSFFSMKCFFFFFFFSSFKNCKILQQFSSIHFGAWTRFLAQRKKVWEKLFKRSVKFIITRVDAFGCKWASVKYMMFTGDQLLEEVSEIHPVQCLHTVSKCWFLLLPKSLAK